MNSDKKKILVSTIDEPLNRGLLKAARKNAKYGTDFRKNMSRRQLSIPLGVGEIQISRYQSSKETLQQLPRIDVFKKLCLRLQIDPADLLGLVWIEGDDEVMELVDKENKFCPTCGSLVKVEEHE